MDSPPPSSLQSVIRMTAAATPVLGRRAELAAVDAALRALEGRGGAMLAFSGEPGIGKSRLLDELRARAEARDHVFLAGRASELERELPFGVWVDALAEHCEALGPERLERLVGDHVDELAPVLGGSAAGLQDERYRTHRAVRTLLEALALRRPVVLALDDLHWADDASLELVAHLLRRPPRAPLLLALAFRPAPVRPLLAGAIATAERDGTVAELALDPAVARRRRGAVGRRGARSRARRDLRRGRRQPVLPRAAGARARVGSRRRDGRRRARRRPACRARWPGRSTWRSPRLSASGRLLAQGAAVAGDPVDLDLAADAAGLVDAAALEALDELLAGALLAGTHVPRRYRFRHPLVRHAIYDSTTEGWRIAAHARAAAALAARGGSLTARAHHLARCARPGDAEALEVLVEAARGAAARAPATAADWFAAALRLLPETPDAAFRRLELLVGVAQALAATGELERALEALTEGLELVGPELAPVRARLVAGCAMCENLLGRHAAAHARLLSALDALGETGSAAAADLQVELAADALYDSDFAAVREWARRAAASAATLDAPALATLAAGLECFAELGLGATARAAGAAGRGGGPVRRAGRRRARRAHRRRLLPGVRRVLLRALRRRHPPPAPGDRRVARVRAGPVRDPDDDRPRARPGGTRPARRGRRARRRRRRGARLLGNRQMLCFALTADAWVSALSGELPRARSAGDEAMALLDGLDESVLSRSTASMWPPRSSRRASPRAAWPP